MSGARVASRSRDRWWAAVALGAFLLPRAAAAGSVGQIFHGDLTTAEPAVAELRLDQTAEEPSGLCSGTLIAPAVVLTAAHCLARVVRVVAVFLPDGVTRQEYEAASWAVHPSYSSARAYLDDIAVVRLAEPVAGVDPMPRVARHPRPGARGLIVGFGLDDQDRVGRKEMGETRVRRCPQSLERFDLPPGAFRTVLCERRTRSRQNVCPGDSGGPLIVNGKVAGVAEAALFACNSPRTRCCPSPLGWHTNVALYNAWIDAMLGR